MLPHLLTIPLLAASVPPQDPAAPGAGAAAPCRISVTGCGSGHDVAELARRRLDVTQRRPSVPFDAAYEQTCLCAMHPAHWRRYELALA